MDPGSVGEVGVGAGDDDGRGPDAVGDAFDCGDRLLGEFGGDEVVADAEQVGGAEAPGIVAADEERMFEGRLDAVFDDEEALVLAEGDLRDDGRSDASVIEAFGGLPVVLGAEGRIDFEPGDGHREDLVARLKRFDGAAPGRGDMDERAEEEAVGAGTPT